MPIYEYACSSCNHEFEVWQKPSRPRARKCEACGKRTARRQMSVTSFSLKGGGWYADGYGAKASAVKSDSAASTSG